LPIYPRILAIPFLALVVSWVAAVGRDEAGAAEIYRGEELEARLDTTLSVGAALRVSDRDDDAVFIENGGSATNPEFLNRDDGNLNYDNGDFYTANAKALFELDVQWRNFGAFVRTSAFYDAVGNSERNRTQRTRLSSSARNRDSVIEGGVIGSQLLLLDAYADVHGNVADRPLEVRVGRQVISWGQSIFIQGGINQINAIEVSKVRSPGVEFGKEALFPAGLVRVSTEIFDGLGIESYYQFEWNRTYLDPLGAYFSVSDNTGRGAEGLYFGVAGRYVSPADPVPPPIGDPGSNPVLPPADLIPAIPALGTPALPAFPGCGDASLGQAPCAPTDFYAVAAGVPRSKDRKPPSGKQWGAALRYFVEPLRSELALYYSRYHSKTPVIGMEGITIIFPLGMDAGFRNQPLSYFRQYASDIDNYGVSLDTEVFDIAIGVEASYRPNEPVVVNPNSIVQGPPLTLDGPAPSGAGGSWIINGFEREERYQFQLNGTYNVPPGNRLFGPLIEWIRADNMILIAEAAVVVYPGLKRSVPYAGPPENPTSRTVDETSWGYQLLLQLPYSNPLGIPIDLTPRIIWQHDVQGDTPNLFPFIQDRLGISAGFAVDYLQTWSFDVGYTNFFNAGPADILHDRDFVSATLKYRF
jgi:hypothetical protein